MLAATALALAATAASYYYPGWSNLRYLTADPQTRQRLETEELERGYRDAAKALERELGTTALPKDAETENCNEVIFNARQKAMQMKKDLIDELNSFLAKHSRGPINLDGYMEDVFPDTMLIKEIRVDSVSEKPTSIHTDNDDLIQRYHADVRITFSIRGGPGKEITGQDIFVASATPRKQWKFPSATDAKVRILAEIKAGMQSATDSQLKQIKQDQESQVHKMELKVLTESPR